jgi:hypothetical protein
MEKDAELAKIFEKLQSTEKKVSDVQGRMGNSINQYDEKITGAMKSVMKKLEKD